MKSHHVSALQRGAHCLRGAVASRIRKRLSSMVNDQAVSCVAVTVGVVPRPVDTHHETLVLDGPRLEQGAPRVALGSGQLATYSARS